MGDPQIFDGKPVLQFGSETNRRSFLKYAGLVGVGATFVAGGILNAPFAAANAPAVAKGGPGHPELRPDPGVPGIRLLRHRVGQGLPVRP